jgi:hypothetical protein
VPHTEIDTLSIDAKKAIPPTYATYLFPERRAQILDEDRAPAVVMSTAESAPMVLFATPPAEEPERAQTELESSSTHWQPTLRGAPPALPWIPAAASTEGAAQDIRIEGDLPAAQRAAIAASRRAAAARHTQRQRELSSQAFGSSPLRAEALARARSYAREYILGQSPTAVFSGLANESGAAPHSAEDTSSDSSWP